MHAAAAGARLHAANRVVSTPRACSRMAAAATAMRLAASFQ
jgi:hypothetical protein